MRGARHVRLRAARAARAALALTLVGLGFVPGVSRSSSSSHRSPGPPPGGLAGCLRLRGGRRSGADDAKRTFVGEDGAEV
jgi:hypothetical protein